MVKRYIDIFGAVVGIALFSPLMLAILLLIRLTSEGDPVFRQKRAGIYGRPFTMYKFRTMNSGVSPYAPSPGSGHDTRLTPVGRLIRELSLDELPQLWNVLEGSMSLVGPRPLYQSHICQWDKRQKRRLEVRPGITGLSQISGRGRLAVEDKLELDVRYVETRNNFLDLKIIAMTLIKLARFDKSNIYEDRLDATPDAK